MLETYGGDCAALSEVKIDVDMSLNTQDAEPTICFDLMAHPNLFNSCFNLEINSNCMGEATIWVEDAMGRKISDLSNQNDTYIDASNWDAGIYFIVAVAQNSRLRK